MYAPTRVIVYHQDVEVCMQRTCILARNGWIPTPVTTLEELECLAPQSDAIIVEKKSQLGAFDLDHAKIIKWKTLKKTSRRRNTVAEIQLDRFNHSYTKANDSRSLGFSSSSSNASLPLDSRIHIIDEVICARALQKKLEDLGYKNVHTNFDSTFHDDIPDIVFIDEEYSKLPINPRSRHGSIKTIQLTNLRESSSMSTLVRPIQKEDIENVLVV